MNAKLLGANIRKYRRARKLTQEQMAEACALSTNYYRQIELGNKVPKFETFLRIAEALQVSTDRLVTGLVSWTSEIRANELSDALAELSPQQRDYILAVVESMVQHMSML